MEGKEKQPNSTTKWLGGIVLAIGIILMAVGVFVHEGPQSAVILRIYFTLGASLVICSIVTLLVG